MNALEKRSVAALASVYAMRMLGLFMVMPVFVLLGQDLDSATPALIGLAIGAYGLSQALLQVPFGLLSDRVGRKRMIYIGLVLFAAGSMLAAVSDSIYGVIAGRVLQGSGAIASVLMALLSDLTREEQRTKAMATVGMSIGLSFSVSLVLGPLLASAFGLHGIFFVTAALALIALVVVNRVVPTPHQHLANADTRPVKAMLSQVIRDGRLLRLDFGIFALHLVLTALFLVVPLILKDKLGLPTQSHWWFYLTIMVTSFFAMVPFIIIGEKKRKMKPVLSGAILLLTLATAGLEVAVTGLGVAWGVLFLFFMAFNLLEASLPSLISKEAPAASKGTAMGVYSTSQFLGAFVGGAVGGLLLEQGGVTGVVWPMVAVLVCWLLLALTMPNPRYTTSFVVKLRDNLGRDIDRVDAALRGHPGVQDVVILEGTAMAYLKVDRDQFEEESLAGYDFVRQGSS
ncbi:MFS transporter [Marinobacter zhejiangensis]|uniref:Predicted arabinose efflux permease, MFS family n=1 Tax=Marinobacter zhejiangensis TaxID=488535 RepID=A0A1I4SDU1_9GAMM|nr:MFS transporter [Marinobacter zhejiangensis]SFM62659.1 Predicted arabinose efflux permease, MFS family [Marinobacter zhejiangensis]